MKTSVAEFFLQPFNEEVGCGAVERVLNRQMVDLIDFFAIRVRKLATCLGTNRVNRAKVV